MLSVPTGPVELTIRNPLCCEAKAVTVGAEQRDISATLDFLPGTVVPECSWPDVSVRIDGKLARIGRPTTIALKNTLGRRRVHIEFFNEQFYETDVDVRYNETVVVTCER